MTKSVSIEESIFKQKVNLSKLGLQIKKVDAKKDFMHNIVGSRSSETDKLQKQWAGMKVKERSLELNLSKSEAFLKQKQAKKPKVKKYKSFSEHLFGKMG